MKNLANPKILRLNHQLKAIGGITEAKPAKVQNGSPSFCGSVDIESFRKKVYRSTFGFLGKCDFSELFFRGILF